MPSNKKRRVRARMAKTGERYAAALRQVRGSQREPPPQRGDKPEDPFVPPTPGVYRGEPKLPPATPNLYVSKEGYILPDDPSRPVVEFVDIQGEYHADDLHKVLVPSTAFEDALLPKGVLRVLSLGEYIDARARQTGWTLTQVTPGPVQAFELMGISMSMMLHIQLTWTRQSTVQG